ncbi:rab11 family-interacting protein 4-like [Rhinoderma darwinii]|uniref:rab11 family-interacting protein 4-like n=1 Tax=Rhinoderma darwinii TaxID=43563 RepID=UPI003F66FC54
MIDSVRLEDQGHVHKLREVFDVCDEDADGFIRVEDFIDLGQQFTHGEEVEKLAKYLDPNDLGRINFKDFCQGVLAIKRCDELLKGVLRVNSRKSPQYQARYVGFYYQRPPGWEEAFGGSIRLSWKKRR